MSLEANKALVRRMFDHLDQGNVEVCDAICTSDFLCHYPKTLIPKPQTRDEYKQYLSANAGAFQMQHTSHDLIAEGDKVVWRVTVAGHHEPTGKSVELSATGIGRVRDGQLAEIWVEADYSGMLQELGVTLEQPQS